MRSSRRIFLGYGVGDLGGNLFFTILAFWFLNYLTDQLLIPVAIAGAALLVGKVWDAVTDPVMGVISDRTRLPGGRRRPYLLAGGLLLWVTFALLFVPPPVTGAAAVAWIVVAYCLVNTAYTVAFVPYNALTPELATGSDERTVLNSYRMTFAIVGTLLGAGAFQPVVASIGYPATGIAFGALIAAAVIVTFAVVREPPRPAETPAAFSWRIFLAPLSNPTFLRVVIPWTLHITAVAMVSGMVVFYFKYVFQREALATVALLVLLVVALVSIQGWVIASRKLEKKTCYAAGMAIFGVSIVLAALVGHLSMVLLFALLAVAGVGMATIYIFPWSLLPDVIDEDWLRTGTRREGLYYGLWTFLQKLGQALAPAVTGAVLALTGYVPEQTQAAAAQLGIRALVGPLPGLLILAGILVLAGYPLTRERHAAIRRQLEDRGAGDPTASRA